MEKDSALYQLMDTRMHSVMNGIVSSDGEYQAILRKSDVYSGELDRMDLSKEVRLYFFYTKKELRTNCLVRQPHPKPPTQRLHPSLPFPLLP